MGKTIVMWIGIAFYLLAGLAVIYIEMKTLRKFINTKNTNL